MPRPPTLPAIDWKAVFASGLTYPAWLAAGEAPENQARMEALRQAQVLDEPTRAALAALPHPVQVVVIAEDWCGDVVRHVPVLQRMSEAAGNLRPIYLTRQQHPEVFVRFLTNGGEAIPKFIFLSEAWVECGHWGPMPEACRELIARGKACGDVASARKLVSAQYEADPDRREVIREVLKAIDIASGSGLGR